MGSDLDRSERSAGVLVEFVGLPGSGKSRISHAIADILEARGVEVTEPTYRITHATVPPVRMTIKLGCALWGFLLAPRSGVAWFAALLASRQRSAGEACRAILNWFYVLGLMRQRGRRRGVHLFDQGPLQAWWSIAYGACRSVLDSTILLAELRAVIPKGLVVVRLTVSEAVIQERLRTRKGGRSRLDSQTDVAPPEMFHRGSSTLHQLDGVVHELAADGHVRLLYINNDGPAAPEAGVALTADAIELLLAHDLTGAVVHDPEVI